MALAWKPEINYLGGRRKKGRRERRKEEGTILLENILNMANPKHAAFLLAEQRTPPAGPPAAGL